MSRKPNKNQEKGVELAVVSRTAEGLPDGEVLAGPKRRTFSAKYKQRILREADACTGPGEIGALLRREGLYSSHLSAWRAAAKRGERQGLSTKRGPTERTVSEREHKRLQRENEKLKQELATARLIIEAQKKLSEVLETTLPPAPEQN